MTNHKNTTIKEKYQEFLGETALIASITTIKPLIERIYTTINSIQYFGTVGSI